MGQERTMPRLQGVKKAFSYLHTPSRLSWHGPSAGRDIVGGLSPGRGHIDTAGGVRWIAINGASPHFFEGDAPSTVTHRRSAASSSSSSSPTSPPGAKRSSLFTSDSEEMMWLFLVVDDPATALDEWAGWANKVVHTLPLWKRKQVMVADVAGRPANAESATSTSRLPVCCQGRKTQYDAPLSIGLSATVGGHYHQKLFAPTSPK